MAKKNRPSKRIGSKQREELLDSTDISPAAQKLDKSILDLSPVQVKEMAKWIKARIDSAKNSKSWTEAKARIVRLREEYENGVARTATGMQGAHDYRTKIAAAQTDGMIARILSIFSVDPLLKFEGRNTKGLENARNVELFVDYHHDVNVKLQAKGDEISSLMGIEGHCVLYTPWVLEIKKDKKVLVQKQLFSTPEGKTLKIDSEDTMALETAKAGGAVPKTPISFIVEEEKKTQVVKNWPDLKVFSLLDYLCPESAKPGLDHVPAWEAVRIPFTLADIEALSSQGKVYPGLLKELKTHLKKPSMEAEPAKESPGGGADEVREDSDEPHEKDALDSVLQIWVIWGQQKVPGKKGLQDVASLYHEESGIMFQTRDNTNIDTAPPMFHLRLMALPWRQAGMGMMEMASDGEKAINDLANFVLDEGRIYSCLPYKYNKKKFPGGIPPFEFWKGIGLLNMKDFEALQFPDRRGMDMNVAGFVRANTERRTGQGDLQLGRESDTTGKTPPTARGIISILREGQVRYTKFNFPLITALTMMGQFEVKLFQQYLSANTVVEVLGEEGREVFPEGVSRHLIFGSFYVTANMAAQQMARELDAELNMMLYDRFKDNPFIASSLSSFYDMTRDVLQSLGKKKLWIKPLKFYQKAAGKGVTEAEPQPAEGQITPEEQQFLTELLQAGVPIEVAKQELEKRRSGVSPEDQAAGDEAEAQMLMGGGNAA